MQACDPREVLLFLPRLAEILSRAASYVHTATVHAAITYLPASPEDPQATPAAEEAQAGGDAQTAAAAGERVSMSEVTQGKRVFDEVAEHLLALSVRALGRLKRRNAAHVGDVLVFAGRATMAYVRPTPALPVSVRPPRTPLGACCAARPPACSWGGVMGVRFRVVTVYMHACRIRVRGADG